MAQGEQAVEAQAILEHSRTIAVVGLSPNPQRTSHRVARYMREAGYEIIPVNPAAQGEIIGAKVYASLSDIPVPVDVVDVFRRSEDTDPVIDEAIAIGARALWLQLGIRNDAGIERADRAGLTTVQDRCILIEHALRIRHVLSEYVR